MKLTKIYAQEIKRKPIDMALSENPLGCSPSVVEAVKNIKIREISRYPDSKDLVKKIAKCFKIKPENILIGCGSEQLIKLIVQVFLEKKDLALIQRGSFPLFTKECLLKEARIRFFQPNVGIKKLKARLIFLCNPNNPTGEIIDSPTIKTIVQKAKNSIVVIDEANGEFMKNSFILPAAKRRNCIVLKTFSKVFGLAGLRVGFAVGPVRLIKKLSLAQQPFPISSLSCKLVGLALADRNFIDKTIKFMEKERLFLTAELKKRDLKVSNSLTNNLFIESPVAKLIIAELNNRGVSVVPGLAFPGMKRSGFRVSIKDNKTNRLFLTKLDKVLACMKEKKLLRSEESI